MTPMRLLRIGLRLSLVVGVVMGIYSAVKEAERVGESKASAEHIWSGLVCAAKFENQELERVKTEFGNYDISKLGCGSGSGPNGAFIASAAEIEEARRNDSSGIRITPPFNLEVPLSQGIGAFIIVNVVAGLMALTGVVARWVIR